MPEQKRALVTGASRGIGRAITETLSSEGWDVVGTFRDSNKGADELARSYGVKMVNVDLGVRAQCLDLATSLKMGQPLDALINNAGVIEFEAFEDLTLLSWDRVFEVNLTCPLILCQALAQHMATGGSIVNVASTDASVGSYSSIAYSASKAGLVSLTRSLANILGPRGVRVNAVLPGWIETSMATPASNDAASLTPLGRNGRPVDVAKLVEFLVSDSASFINGASYVIDGGYSGVDVILRDEAAT